MLKLLPYKPGSKGAKALAQALGIKRLKRQGSAWNPPLNSYILNWGSNDDCGFGNMQNWINHPTKVQVAQSKRFSLSRMKEAGVRVPAFTHEHQKASAWLHAGNGVIGRKLDRGSSGRGIVYMKSPDEFEPCPFYTLYVPKFDEYRIHVFGGKVIDAQQKRRRHGADYCNKVRTASKGWVFTRQGVNPPKPVTDQALAAVAALGLDFGAVDIGYTKSASKATVYEVNTAPGLEGTTLVTYRNAVTQFVTNGQMWC